MLPLFQREKEHRPCQIVNKQDEDKRRSVGRPALPPEEKAVPGSVRLTPSRWAKLRKLGSDWLNKTIDKAKLPED